MLLHSQDGSAKQRPRIHEVIDELPMLYPLNEQTKYATKSPDHNQSNKRPIMTKRREQGQTSKSKDYKLTFVQNSNETDDLIGAAAKASSIGSTDKRSQVSSDDLRKKEYLSITEPTMHAHLDSNGANSPIETLEPNSGN